MSVAMSITATSSINGSVALRPLVLRPQLKRDPLGSHLHEVVHFT
jgi:hypothetical protein